MVFLPLAITNHWAYCKGLGSRNQSSLRLMKGFHAPPGYYTDSWFGLCLCHSLSDPCLLIWCEARNGNPYCNSTHKELSLRKSKHQDMGLNLASFSKLPTYPLLRDQVARRSLSFHRLACVTRPRYNLPYLSLSLLILKTGNFGLVIDYKLLPLPFTGLSSFLGTWLDRRPHQYSN